ILVGFEDLRVERRIAVDLFGDLRQCVALLDLVPLRGVVGVGGAGVRFGVVSHRNPHKWPGGGFMLLRTSRLSNSYIRCSARPSRTTGSSRSSAGAAWASCTAPRMSGSAGTWPSSSCPRNGRGVRVLRRRLW